MKKQPFLATIRAETVRAREAVALSVYDQESVRVAISKASGEGFNEVCVISPRPLDLRATPAAGALIKYLNDCGFRVEWLARNVDQNGVRLTTYDLHIAWQVGF